MPARTTIGRRDALTLIATLFATACGQQPGRLAEPAKDLPPSPTPGITALPAISRAAEATRTPAPTSTATVAPPTVTPPTVTPTRTPTPAAEVKDVLGSSETSYAGSIAARAHNVELATTRLNGVEVAPGAVFSFNEALGGVTLSKGFKIGYGITLRAGQAETVESVGGGICQVSTTLFQAAFWAGMAIVEHSQHLYWIAKYGKPPKGRVGLDATVDEPALDFKFQNATDDWVRIDAWVAKQSIGFAIIGVDLGWEVTVGEPRISNVVPTNPEIVRREDPTLAPGQELWIESAENGFDVQITRIVNDKDGKLLSEHTKSHRFLPARNVLLVGTRGATPTPQPSHAPEPTEESPQPARTPQAQATPTPDPKSLRFPNGKIRVPSVVGLPEAQARSVIEQTSLANSFTNYQGRDQVPENVRTQVPVGAVLSQTPGPGTEVAPGTTILIAVRKE